MSYYPLSKLGYTFPILKSYLQKSVRRGLINQACWAIVEIFSYIDIANKKQSHNKRRITNSLWKGVSSNLINRLAIMHFEDIAFLEDKGLFIDFCEIYRKWDFYEYRSTYKAKEEIIQMVIRMCKAKKSRVIDHIIVSLMGNPKFRTVDIEHKYQKIFSTKSKSFEHALANKSYDTLNFLKRDPSKSELQNWWTVLSRYVYVKDYQYLYKKMSHKFEGPLFLIAPILEILEESQLLNKRKILISENKDNRLILVICNKWKIVDHDYFTEHQSIVIPSWAIDMHSSIAGMNKSSFTPIVPKQMTYSSFALVGSKLENEISPWKKIWCTYQRIFLEYMLWKDGIHY